MKKSLFEKSMSSAFVSRWHTKYTAQPQDVGNHTFRVMQLIMFVTDGNPSRELLMRALYHDVPEVDLGDIPFGCKGDDAHTQEKSWIEKYEMPCPELSKDDEALLKQCDLLEMALYAAEEANLGNRKMLHVVLNVLGALDGEEVSANVGNLLSALEGWLKAQPEAAKGSRDDD